MRLDNLLLGRDINWLSTLTRKRQEELSNRHKFSDYLPYHSYDEEQKLYINSDNTVGFIWECSPLIYAGEETIEQLDGLSGIGVPEGSILQFILYADPYIDPILDDYKLLKKRRDPLIQEATERVVEFLRKGTKGLDKINNIPVRDFKLFVALKIPEEKLSEINLGDIRAATFEGLKGAGLSPRYLPPSELIFLLFRIFNNREPQGANSWDRLNPINRQIISADTVIERLDKGLRIGDRIFRCLTPRKIPSTVSLLISNLITGGIWGLTDDVNQIRTPFFISLNIYFCNVEMAIRTKTSIMSKQKLAASVAEDMKNRLDEFLWACGEIDKGTKFIRAMWSAWVIGESEEEARESVMTMKRIWEKLKFVMDEERGLSLVLFQSSLPFGLIAEKKNIISISRDHITSTKAALTLAPVQADFSGGGLPSLLFIGRKGQLISLDLFDKHANNMNGVICATTGSGKSFLTNYIVYNYYATGAKVRIVDIGGSYRKLSKMFNGRFIEFKKDSQIVINPFSCVKNAKDEEDFLSNLQSIVSIIGQMCYAATKQPLNETEFVILQKAIQWTYQHCGSDASIDGVFTYLCNYPRYEHEDEVIEEFKTVAKRLSFTLSRFTTYGPYGRWFNGNSTLKITEDPFVVLELEELKPQRELFNVITLAVLDAVTSGLYLGNRDERQLIVFDEAWQFFDNTSNLKNVIEEGYRRARKYGGSFTTITQGITDMEQFGDIGQVILNNSAYKFFLEAKDFDKARNKNLIDYDEWTMKLLKSTKSNRPKYSEIFMDTPFGAGIARLCVDPFTYYIFTSDAKETAKIERLVKEGLSYKEAIEKMVGEVK